MKALSAILAIAIIVSILSSFDVAAREAAMPGLRPARASSEGRMYELVDPGLRGHYEEAAVDTYCLVWYDFEAMYWQGWTRVDNTAPPNSSIYWHVDDFAGLGGGSHGDLAPLEGTKSLWCGSRPNPSDPYLCLWLSAPGYGNNWSQGLETTFGCCDSGPPLPHFGPITFAYKIAYDVEPDHDFVIVEYDAHCRDWERLATYTGRGSATEEFYIPGNFTRTKLRFRFTSDMEGSDEDGLYNSDGACIVDSLCVSDSVGLVYYEDCESAPVGQTGAGIWNGMPGFAFGKYSGLKNNLSDIDPCGENFATQIVFFIGSLQITPAYPWPGLYVTPFCNPYDEVGCQDEMVVSPVIDTKRYSTACNNVQNGTIPEGELGGLQGALLRFTVYADLPYENLVFYRWRVRSIENGRAGRWMDRNLLYWHDSADYLFRAEEIGDLITSDSIQIAVGVVDMCDIWYAGPSSCAEHTPAPWFDNVRLYRFKSDGPQWYARDLDLFQDNFPDQEFDLESYVRADAANDINTNDNPVIRPGDSIVVDCSSPQGGGIAADPAGGPAVYMHVKCAYIGPAPTKPALFGPSLQGTYGWYKSDDGTWTIIQADTARTPGGIQRDRYMFDLNDSLFTRGYQIDYYFTARNVAGTEAALPKWCRSYGPYYEFTCLPTKNSEVLFVDDFTGRGSFAGSVENYWMPIFSYAPGQPNADVDKYDVNGPTSGVSNGPGSRAKIKHLTDQYRAIVWDCGDLAAITISDGTVNSDKSNDCQMIIDWMELSEYRCGLWICGDNVAYDLDRLGSSQALTLMSIWCGVDLVWLSYFDLTGGRTGGGIVTPLITGEADAGIFVHDGVPDKFYAFGGCPTINQFDVLEKTLNGKYALSYPAYNSTNRYAAVASSQLNPAGYNVNTMWFGFSFQYIRDDVFAAPTDQFEIARDVFNWMQFAMSPGCCYADAEVPSAFKLAQNFPNPFNPSTTIRYDMKAKGLVTVKIYDVAGRLVRTLVDEVRDAGAYSAVWDGRNNLGVDAASGIYFYKMEAVGFQATKKLVLLR